MVRTYDEYLKLLEAAMVRNGWGALSDSQIEKLLKIHRLDSDWNITVDDVKKDMEPIVRKFGSRLSPAPKPVTQTRTPAPVDVSPQIKGYADYYRLLEKEIISNGKKELQPTQIEEFIRTYNLKKDWGIVAADVKKDMDAILKKYQSSVSNPKTVRIPFGKPSTQNSKPSPQISKPSTPVGKTSSGNNPSGGRQVKDYNEYIQLLEEAMLKNGRAELSEVQIQRFLLEHKLDVEWSITLKDVHYDMKAISAKFARQDRADALRKKYVAPVAPQPSVNAVSNTDKKDGAEYTDVDEEIAALLSEMIREYIFRLSRL